MRSSSSLSKLSFYSNYSEINFISEVEIEVESTRDLYIDMRSSINTSSGNEEEIFADEPLRDLEWTNKCEKEVKANEEPKRKLKDRFALKQSVNGKQFLSPTLSTPTSVLARVLVIYIFALASMYFVKQWLFC